MTNARELFVGISTNASRRTNFTVSTERFRGFWFSVPGWSQGSYNKVHGLRFERVLANMEATVANMRETGYAGLIHLNLPRIPVQYSG